MKETIEAIRPSVPVFKDWFEGIKKYPKEFRGEMLEALIEFGFTGIIPEGLSGITEGYLTAISYNVQQSINRSLANSKNGPKGGRPPQKPKPEGVPNTEPQPQEPTPDDTPVISESETLPQKPNLNPTQTQPNPNQTLKEKEKVKEKEFITGKAKRESKPPPGLSLSQQKLKDAFPGKQINCVFDDKRYDVDLLIAKIRESDWLTNAPFFTLQRCLKFYKEILADKYKSFTVTKPPPVNIMRHKYSDDELRSLSVSMDEVQI